VEVGVPDYSAAAYTVKVRPRQSSPDDANYRPLSNFDGQQSDVLQFVLAFCNSVTTNPIHHKSEEKYLRVRRVNGQGRVVRTEIESGSHGLVSTLVNVTENSETYRRKATDAELLPLRNLFAVPIDSHVGLFITERVGIRGLRSTLVPTLHRSFSAAYSDFILDIDPLAPEHAVKSALEAGQLKGVRLVRYSIPASLEDQYQIGHHEENFGTMELVLKPRRGLSFRKQVLVRALESGDHAGLLEWNGQIFKDMKLEVKIGGKIRTVTVTKEKMPRVTFPIGDDAELDPSGRPTDSAFYAHSMSIIRDLGEEVGLALERLEGVNFQWTDEMLARVVMVVDLES
jgi:hypothetical protein